MFRKTLILVGAIALMHVPAPARAGKHDWDLGFSAGTAIPRGDFEYRVGAGLIGGVTFDYRAAGRLAVGIDGSIIRNGGKDSYEAMVAELAGTPVAFRYSMLQGGAHLKCTIVQGTVSPFVLIGAGAYRVSDTTESSNPSFSGTGSEMRVGTRAGLGMRSKVNDRVAIDVEVALHGVWTAFSWGNGFEAMQLVSIQTGASMGLGGRAD